jgi:hypothetical protein
MITVKRFDEEPSIEEMLSDPIVRLIMQRDGLVAGDVLAVLAGAAKRLGEGRGEGRSKAA